MLLNMVILNVAYYCNMLGLLKATRYVVQGYNTVINKDCGADVLASDCRWIYLEQLK